MDGDDDGKTSQTRRERRKQSKYFELKQPDRSGPKGKTLLEIAEEREKNLFKLADERRAELAQGTAPAGAADLDEPIGRFGEAVVYTVTMAMLHFTLDVLVYNQYGEKINWATIFSRTAQSIPVILALVYALHRQADRVIAQAFFFALSTLSGCYLIHATNAWAYLAVMKRASPLGTLWVWSVIELRPSLALLSLCLAGAFLRWGNYSVF
ncbi:MAG: hypothetical protein M1840_005021 [Geoglossum simile]|nr:MAG: hypothetical protein M1840_005021 [Geoglossum simile]